MRGDFFMCFLIQREKNRHLLSNIHWKNVILYTIKLKMFKLFKLYIFLTTIDFAGVFEDGMNSTILMKCM